MKRHTFWDTTHSAGEIEVLQDGTGHLRQPEPSLGTFYVKPLVTLAVVVVDALDVPSTWLVGLPTAERPAITFLHLN